MTAVQFRLACLAFVIVATLTTVIWRNPSILGMPSSASSDSSVDRSIIEEWDPAVIREVPLRFPVRNDLAVLVSDRELKEVLDMAVPRWDPPTVPIMLHALRLWGPEATFPVSDVATEFAGDCREYRRILMNNDECVRVVGQFDEFLIDTHYGVRVLTWGDPILQSKNSEGHYDQVLKVFGECGVRAADVVTTAADSQSTVADLLRDSLARFSLLQELEFSAIAFARWLPPAREWKNRFDERFTFDDLVQGLVDQPLGMGACQGCHVPYALTSIWLASQEYPDLISADARTKLEGHLREISNRLEDNAIPSGGWDKRWSGEYVDKVDNVFFEFKPHFDRISATGHHLEWIALVPPELRPESIYIERAAKALVAEITHLSGEDRTKPKGYLPLTHAARALCLMRGHDRAFSLWQQLHSQPE